MASASTSAVTAPAPKAVPQKAIAKIVMSGDSVVIRGQPKGGPPPEKTIGISNIIAPKLGRRPQEGTAAVKDEPFAWEAREFLRKKIIGQEVHFVVDYKVPSTGREFGYLFLPRGSGEEPENLAETLVSEGLVEVRLPPNNRPADEYLTRLLDLQTSAKSGGKGKWGPDAEVATHVRDVQWTHDNPRHLVDSMHQQPCKAVIEHVRDGSTVRAFLLPDMHHVTLMISGIKCPIYRVGTGGEVMENEAYAEEARYFTEVGKCSCRKKKLVKKTVYYSTSDESDETDSPDPLLTSSSEDEVPSDGGGGAGGAGALYGGVLGDNENPVVCVQG